jgi:hypothetical protein
MNLQADQTNMMEKSAVRRHIVTAVCKQFGVLPMVDVFASKENTRFAQFYSVQKDGMQQDGACQCIWVNPPWVLWPATLKKLLGCPCTAVCVAPAWKEPWVKELLANAKLKQYFPGGTKFFEYAGKPLKPCTWPMWIVLIETDAMPPDYAEALLPAPTVYCPHPMPTPPVQVPPEEETIKIEEKKTISKGAKRLQRRLELRKHRVADAAQEQ